MHSLSILEPGMLTTVQSLGLARYLDIGVPEGGAADALSLTVGNRLLGNLDHAAALEFTLTGATVRFEGPATIAITGGEAHIQLEGADGRALDTWNRHGVGAGDVVRIGPVTRGCRAYLCVSGGIAVQETRFGASTNLRAGFGGHHGRALRAGDRLDFDPSQAQPVQRVIDADRFAPDLLDRRTLRAIELPLGGRFDPDGAGRFWRTEFTVSNRSDRAGIRLEGALIPTLCAGRMISEGMPHGAIQIPEGGEPIVLGVDHPTTGGYPVLACIASVDLPTLGQLRPRDKVRFERVSVSDAHRLLRARSQSLRNFPKQEAPAR